MTSPTQTDGHKMAAPTFFVVVGFDFVVVATLGRGSVPNKIGH